MDSLDDKFLWDYWLYKEGNIYHKFYLQASRSIGDPDLRHNQPTVGHCISKDLLNWTQLPDALVYADTDYDSHQIATGSIIKHEHKYYMLYSGRSESSKYICLATSDDLTKWTRHPANPIMEIDTRYYDPDGAFADPFIYFEPKDKGYYAFFKAYDKTKPKGYQGCIGASFSSDLITWEILPPIFSPGIFREPEVPAVYKFGSKYFLITMTIPPSCTDKYAEIIYPAKPQWGDIYAVSENLLTGYKPYHGVQLTNDSNKMMMVRIIENPDGQPVALSWWQGYPDYWKDNSPLPMLNECCIHNAPRKIEIDPDINLLKIIED